MTESALNKYQHSQKQTITDKNLLEVLHTLTNKADNGKRTILIKKYDGFIPVPVSDFALFFIDNCIVYGLTHKEEKYVINETLDVLEIGLTRSQMDMTIPPQMAEWKLL